MANLAASASDLVFPKFWRVAGRVGQQAKTDKVAALKLLYSSVSTTVRYLYHIANPTSNREFQFRTAVVSLRDTGLMTHSLALALLRFQHFCLRATTQKLRDAPASEDAVLGAIQDGFSLLQVLLSLADERKALLGPRGAGDEAE